MHLMQEEASTVSLRFLGAAGTVTGSRFLLEREGREPFRVLLDCGCSRGSRPCASATGSRRRSTR
ncbi:hypothetical protein [Corallococcus sp. 4LFB]|uniref:hypothetical protein n=1 Tax=Corallococcus sp. 4LFB TaxID=3383249 RepID=UPI003974DBDF